MSLAKTYTIMCDVCGVWDGVQHETASEARKAAHKAGFQRLASPRVVELHYFSASRAPRHDYCRACAPAIVKRLAEIAELIEARRCVHCSHPHHGHSKVDSLCYDPEVELDSGERHCPCPGYQSKEGLPA